MRTLMCSSAVRPLRLGRNELRSLTMWMCFDVYSEQKCSSTTAITRFSTVLIPLALSDRLFVLVSS